MGRLGKDKKKMTSKNSSAQAPTLKHQVSTNWFSYLKTDDKHFRKTVESMGSKQHSGLKPLQATNTPVVTKVLSLDCEMVSTMDGKDMLGRVSIVNYKLQCIYDKFVQPTSPVGDYRTRFSGLRERDLKQGVEFNIAQKEVRLLLRNKILVGHALENDFNVLKFKHHKKFIRDTSKYDHFRTISDGQTPALRNLAKTFLGECIQEGEHNSVEDARTAMKLYIKYRHEWESSLLKMNDKKNYNKLDTKFSIVS